MQLNTAVTTLNMCSPKGDYTRQKGLIFVNVVYLSLSLSLSLYIYIYIVVVAVAVAIAVAAIVVVVGSSSCLGLQKLVSLSTIFHEAQRMAIHVEKHQDSEKEKVHYGHFVDDAGQGNAYT